MRSVNNERLCIDSSPCRGIIDDRTRNYEWVCSKSVVRAEKASWNNIKIVIQAIPFYKERLNSLSLSYDELPINHIKPICLYARSHRIDRLKCLILAYKKCSIPLMAGMHLRIVNGEHRFIVPPIVEVHSNSYVLVNGRHRLFLLVNQELVEDVPVVLIRGNLPPLPGDVLSWENVKEICPKKKKNREEKFKNYRGDEYIRKISDTLNKFSFRSPESFR